MVRKVLHLLAYLIVLQVIAWVVNAVVLLLISDFGYLPNAVTVWYATTARWISYYLIGIAAYLLARKHNKSSLQYVIFAVVVVGLCGWFGYATGDIFTALGEVLIGSVVWFVALITHRKERITAKDSQ